MSERKSFYLVAFTLLCVVFNLSLFIDSGHRVVDAVPVFAGLFACLAACKCIWYSGCRTGFRDHGKLLKELEQRHEEFKTDIDIKD